MKKVSSSRNKESSGSSKKNYSEGNRFLDDIPWWARFAFIIFLIIVILIIG